MQILFFSDLHIGAEDDSLYRDMIRCLKQCQSGDVVVLNGDIFDVYVEKEFFRRKYQSFWGAVKAASERGVEVHYLEGNHDFQLGSQGISFHRGPLTLYKEGKTFHIEHGDLVDTEDRGYRLLYWFFRTPVVRTLFQIVPGSWVAAFGNASSRLSRKMSAEKLSDQTPAKMERTRKLFRQHAEQLLKQGIDFVVMGHCHDLDEVYLDEKGHYINMGYPPFHQKYLRWKPGSPRIERVDFSG